MWDWLSSWLPSAADVTPGFTGQLEREVGRQLDLYETGSVLAYAQAEPHPQQLVDAPANNLGAMYRGAYWLAAAARVALGRNDIGSARDLKAHAEAFRGRARSMSGSRFTTGLFSMNPSGTGSVVGILRDAERVAKQYRITDVAQILSLQQQRRARDMAEARTAGQGALSIPGVDPNAIARYGVGGIAAFTGISGLAILLAVLWFVWPWLAPLFGTVRGAARARREQRRRHRAA